MLAPIILSSQISKETGWSMLMSLMLANTLQGVQEYVYVQSCTCNETYICTFSSNQPSFQPSEILLPNKYIQEIGFGGAYPLTWASCLLPSFDISEFSIAIPRTFHSRLCMKTTRLDSHQKKLASSSRSDLLQYPATCVMLTSCFVRDDRARRSWMRPG